MLRYLKNILKNETTGEVIDARTFTFADPAVLYSKRKEKQGVDVIPNWNDKYLYFGNLFPHEKQHQIDRFVALTPYPCHPKEIQHDIYDPLPCPPGSICKIQAQDVFEHLTYEKIPSILDNIYLALRPGGVFRLSVPDYHSPLLKKRSTYDANGNVIADMRCVKGVYYDENTGGVKVEFTTDGNSHLWFPTHDKVRDLINRSNMRLCSEIIFYHTFLDDERYVCDPIPENEMFVMRAPPNDMRSDGKPISIVVDFIK